MTVCLMLCAVAEKLINKYGCEGAEKVLIDNPDITAQMIMDEETPAMLKAYDIIADYILDMDMFYFGKSLGELVKILSVYEYSLAFFPCRVLVCWYLAYCDVRRTFSVGVNIEIVEACASAYLFGEFGLFHI